MYDLIIVGAGTAGLTAAIYGQRAGKHVLLLEEGIYGGQIINSPEIENYPGISKVSGYQFAMNLYEQAASFGAKLETGKVIGLQLLDGKKQVKTQEAVYECGAVILATGAKKRRLGLDREDALIGRGISYCAACDGAFYKGKTVAVVGGGNTALEDADYLSNACDRVYLLHRREAFRGDDSLLQRVKKRENVTILTSTVVEGLLGGEQLEQLQIKNTVTGERKTLELNGLFVAIGQQPENEAFRDLLALDKEGYVIASEDCKTNVPWIFAAGDCRTKPLRQLTTAAADGAVAALAACEYLNA